MDSVLTSILNLRPSAYTLADSIMVLISGAIELSSASFEAFSPKTKATRKNLSLGSK